MNTYDFSTPDDAEAFQNARSRALNEAMMAQAINGGPVYSDRAALARVLMGALSGAQLQGVARKERDLAAKKEAGRQAEMGQLFEFINQRPTQGPGMPQMDDEGNPLPGNMEQTAAKRMELARAMLGSRNPMLQQVALGALSPKEEEAYTLPEGAERWRGGKLIASNPKTKEPDKEPESVRALKAQMQAAGIDPTSPMGKSIFEAAIKKQTTHQPATKVEVNTGKKFGETLATEVAQQVAQSADAARGAVDTLNTAKQIETALASGKVMAGPGTTGIMWVQQAIGAPSNAEGLVKTREVIQGLSQMTLAARKQLKGQGQVSDFEGKLLAKAASGDIDSLTIPEIQTLVKTATRLANGSITQHQQYLKKIESDPELKGLAPFFNLSIPQGDSNPAIDEILKLYPPKN